MNRKTRAILSLAGMLSLGTAADQAIRDVRTVGFVDTDGSKLKAIVLSSL